MDSLLEQLAAEIRELKKELLPVSNTLPIATALIRLGRSDSPNTWRKWRNERKTNDLGIPLTKGFHWTDIGGCNLKLREVEAWLANDPSQWDELVQWRKSMVKAERIRTSQALSAKTQ
jgi:hypothetical protein